MSEGLELFASTLIQSFVSLIVPILILIIAGVIEYKPKVKKIVLNVLSIIYSWVVGIVEVYVFMLMHVLVKGNMVLSIVLTSIVALIYIVPMYLFVLKKANTTKWKYLLVNIVSFLLAIVVVSCILIFN